MQQEPLTFCELMTQIPSIDSQDRAKSLDKTIETEYKILMRKISEYGQKGELNIKIVFNPQKDTKCGLTIEATVTAKAPKGKPKVNFYEEFLPSVFFVTMPYEKGNKKTYTQAVELLFSNNDGELEITVFAPDYETTEEQAIVDEANTIQELLKEQTDLLVLPDFY